MKNNTNATKNYLRQALINAPDDFSLQEVKVLIVKAMEAIERAEANFDLLAKFVENDRETA